MAFDPKTFFAEAREQYIRIGRRIGPVAALAQANKTLGALARCGAHLVRNGFGTNDAQELADARDALQVEVVGRGAELREKRVSRSAVTAALARASGERDAARTILHAAGKTLLEAGDTDAVNTIEAALRLTAVAPARNAGLYADQLEHLRATLLDPVVAPATAHRGGPQAAHDLAATLATLREAAHARKGGGGTPLATERVDLLEGVVVTLARQAFRAARAAGKRMGMPALATELALTHVAKTRRRRAAGESQEAQASEHGRAAGDSQEAKGAEHERATGDSQEAKASDPAALSKPDEAPPEERPSADRGDGNRPSPRPGLVRLLPAILSSHGSSSTARARHVVPVTSIPLATASPFALATPSA